MRRWAEQVPEAPSLVFGERQISWEQLHVRSTKVAAGLAAEGIGSQDRVAVLGANDVAQFEVLFGGAMLNATHVAVNWRLAPPEIADVLNDSEAKVLVVSGEHVSLLETVASRLTKLKKILVIDGRSGADDHDDYDLWVSHQTGHDPEASTNGDDIALQLYTSGTTGLPKGVMITNDNLSFIDDMGATFGLDPETVNLVAMPLFHMAGLGWALIGMAHGARSVLLREFDPHAVIDVIPDHRVTHAVLVPAALLFVTLVPNVEETDFSSLDVVLYGASPISEELLGKCLQIFGCRFFQAYGLTETSGVTTLLYPEDHLDADHPERLRSAGRPIAGVEIRIVDTETAEDVIDGTVGEIWIRGSTVMKGYWRRLDETAQAITADGWFKSGDAGYLRDGYLYLHDRVKDMIVTGGENVYPAEVENALMKHPDVADVGVIGVPSEVWGEEVKAVVVAAPGRDPVPEELISFSRERLAGYKVPKSVDFVDALPRNPSGKILKKDLRAPYWHARQRQVN